MLDGRKLEMAATAAYEAYRAGVEGVAVNGDELPRWPGLKESIRVAWRMAADAAVMVAAGSTPPLPSRWQPVAERFPIGQGSDRPGLFEPPPAEPAGDEAVARSREVDVEVGPDDER